MGDKTYGIPRFKPSGAMVECAPRVVRRYKAKSPPRCNNGAGCRACWAKWDARGVAAPRHIKVVKS